MIPRSTRARQHHRKPWPIDELFRKRAIALGMALGNSSRSSYTSATNSYLHFCDIHNFQVNPTAETLSLYVVYMSHHIDPRSVDQYLFGIASELEPYYPEVRQNRKSMLVSRTLKGCRRMLSKPINRKQPLSRSQIQHVLSQLPANPSYDDVLFVAMLFTGFYGLLRLGELTMPDSVARRDPTKWSLRSSVQWLNEGFSFWLRSHKTDTSFEGSRVVIAHRLHLSAVPLFRHYLTNRDIFFPLNPFLWVTSNGTIPTRSWFMRRLRQFIPDERFAGQSLRAGGATALAEDGLPFHLIQAAGRWNSETFQIYIRKNPVFLQILLSRRHIN